MKTLPVLSTKISGSMPSRWLAAPLKRPAMTFRVSVVGVAP